MRIDCPAQLVTDEIGAPLCVDGVEPVAWIAVVEPSYGDVDPLLAGQFFALGFVLVGGCALLGAGVRAVLAILR